MVRAPIPPKYLPRLIERVQTASPHFTGVQAGEVVRAAIPPKYLPRLIERVQTASPHFTGVEAREVVRATYTYRERVGVQAGVQAVI